MSEPGDETIEEATADVDVSPTEESTAASVVAERKSRVGWYVAAVVVLAGVVFGATRLLGDDEEASAAKATCDRVNADGVSVLEAGIIFSDAVEGGVSTADLRKECGDLIDIVLNQLGDGPLADEVTLELGSCDSDSINGTITNDSNQEVDVTMTYELLDNDGARVYDSLIFADGIDPGQTVKWDESIFDENYDRCHVEVDSVRPAD